MWFQELPSEWKLLWKYVCDKCDEAGIWKVNQSLAEFQLKLQIKWDETDKYINNNKQRIVFNNGFWLLKDFVIFQYGEKVFTSEHPFHRKIREMLDRVSDRVSDRIQVKEQVKDKVIKGGMGGFTPPALTEVETYCLERKNSVDPQKWHSWYTANGWKVGKNPMKDWRAAVRTWERNKVTSAESNLTKAQKSNLAGLKRTMERIKNDGRGISEGLPDIGGGLPRLTIQ